MLLRVFSNKLLNQGLLMHIFILLFSFIFCNFSYATDPEILNIELRNSCNKNHFESCGQLGLVYVETDPKRAIPFFIKACEGGRAASCLKEEDFVNSSQFHKTI